MTEPLPVRFSSQWWEGVTAGALTAIRAEWPVKKLQYMSAHGQDTPVSGDVLAEIKNERR